MEGWIGAVLQEEIDFFFGVMANRGIERGLAKGVECVRVCACVEELLNRMGRAFPCGEV